MYRIRIFQQVAGTQKAESYQHIKTVYVVDNQDQMGRTTESIRWVRIPNFGGSDYAGLELAGQISHGVSNTQVVHINNSYFKTDDSGWLELHRDENEDLLQGLHKLAVKAEGGAAL